MRRVPPPDPAAYLERARRACFVCEIVAGNPDYAHHLVYEDDDAIAFLALPPVQYGYTLVCPKAHREHVTGDFTIDEYLALQRVVRRVGEAVRTTVPCERLYVVSLGSQSGNRHVHWHVVPCPPGLPFEEQQLAALSWRDGVLDLSDEELADLAARLRETLSRGAASGRT